MPWPIPLKRNVSKVIKQQKNLLHIIIIGSCLYGAKDWQCKSLWFHRDVIAMMNKIYTCQTFYNMNNSVRDAVPWIINCGHFEDTRHNKGISHYDDVIMGTITSQITSLTIVYSIVYSDADQRKHQSSASLAFVRGIHRGPVSSPHKWPVTWKMFPFDDVIMRSKYMVCSL